MENDPRIRDVVILGGGTAGWMTAAYLGSHLQGSVRITVLEAPAISKIGVGEATIPNLQRVFFDQLGLSEQDWMPQCNASFKTAVKFINWCTSGVSQPTPRSLARRSDQFYHPFGILPDCDGIPLSHYWFLKKYRGETSEPFDYSCFREPPLMDANLAPCWLDGRPATRYAWHFDAHLVAAFLERHAVNKLGVHHIQDVLRDVKFDDRGFISSLLTEGGRELKGDLFVDCSGFRGLLINRALGEPFLDMNDHLLCNSAVATSLPHDDDKYGVEPYTSAIAMQAGWTWKIPMLSRFGSGYVYSSQFATEDEAVEEFCRLWKVDPNRVPLNKIRFRVGRNRRAWVKNCVSIGLASCFLEPLESSGIYFIYAALYQLAKHFPDRNVNQTLVDRFNREIELMFDDTRDFIQSHFYFSPRIDTPFWRANKELRLTDNIREKIATYRAGLPVNPPIADENTYYGNFEAEFRNFWTNGSYYCIFAGLGLEPDRPLPLLEYKHKSVAEAETYLAGVKQQQQELLDSLPSCHEYLLRLHGHSKAAEAPAA
ncbi:MAG TPA: tryptophan halogenase family protein [Pirellulales bacterium]|nr:tryptophan halogenase family protein [Pirellulales bacterium]